MRLTTILLAAACAMTALAVAAPAAEATNRCTALDPWCPGVVCHHDGVRWSCVLPDGPCNRADPCPPPHDGE